MMDGTTRKPGQDPEILRRFSEQFLRRRHFEDCRKYAQQAQQIDPNFPGVSEILAVADVLLASKHQITTGTLIDWYEVMQLKRYSQDSDLITQRFRHLYALLSPDSNKFPFANEAFDHVCDAWYVLSNPLKKVEFDDSLKKILDGEKSIPNSELAFWTVCPYCYYLYEYPRVYLDYCLRCQNEKCSRAFTCVEIDRPPLNVLTEGKYMCTGFLPIQFQHCSWNPFAPLNKQKVNANDDPGKFVEISDDDNGDCDEVEGKSDKGKPFNVNGEGVYEGSGSLKMEENVPTMKLNVRRKKSVAKKTKKVTGAGNRVTKEGFVNRDDTHMFVASTDNKDDDCKYEMSCGDDGGPLDSRNDGEIEFYDADGDILVSLQDEI